MKKRFLAAALGAALGLGMYAAPADAHGVYYANRVDQTALVLGEGPLDNAYDPACVKRIDAYDVNFRPTSVKRVNGDKNITIVPGENLGVTATFFDYGYFAKTTDGKVIPTRDFSKIKNLKSVTYAYKYNVHYWNALVKPSKISDVAIQIVPEVNPLTLRRGDTLKLRIYKDGAPYANAPVIADVLGDLTTETEADGNGYITVRVANNGLNVIGVEVGFPTDNPKVTKKIFSSLSFILPAE
ncbi:hypothetical protein TAMA11512_24200 [Selenomonas sp. TAMA-11512]|uniref:DUF4198 domain-containing protein n=1 Tax=Selenomonas sp. TAMA-11512 TaxID=3095337 RepID=UPI003085E4D6|nr:hypothetical protein TAMA11512_24200 [Selenomonas sp. TAMA-11512]